MPFRHKRVNKSMDAQPKEYKNGLSDHSYDSFDRDEWTLVTNKKQKNVSFNPTISKTSPPVYEKITIKRNGQTKTF